MKLQRSFYLRSALDVAPELLGKIFVRRSEGRVLTGMISEVEAYLGKLDPASHAYRGRTNRNAIMFGKGGHLYVYFTYGMYYCANAVTGPAELAEAVLIRGVVPIEGLDVMQSNRTRPGKPLMTEHISDGPAKFCQAFGIGRNENGTDLLGDEIFINDAPAVDASDIIRTPRIGITNGKEHLWRFVLDQKH
jgi:DNA-3-methyladenine glycosylase